jgi:exoribonuclease-2
MEAQIRLQFEAALHLRDLRRKHGALELETLQATPVVNHTGQLTDLAPVERNSARDIIENFMIAANVAMAEFLEAHDVTSLRRVVRTPKYWPRIVEIARSFNEELPADRTAPCRFMARRRSADSLHPDLSLSIVKLLGPGEYTRLTRVLKRRHFARVHDYLNGAQSLEVTQRLKSILRKNPYRIQKA